MLGNREKCGFGQNKEEEEKKKENNIWHLNSALHQGKNFSSQHFPPEEMSLFSGKAEAQRKRHSVSCTALRGYKWRLHHL